MNPMDNACFVTSRADILCALWQSKVKGNALGIWSSSLGQGMFICTVKDLRSDEDENDIVILLKDDALIAPRMDSHVVYLNEIERIYTFKIPFETFADDG